MTCFVYVRIKHFDLRDFSKSFCFGMVGAFGRSTSPEPGVRISMVSVVSVTVLFERTLSKQVHIFVTSRMYLYDILFQASSKRAVVLFYLFG